MHDHQQGTPLTPGEWAAVKAPVLVAAGGKSPAWMANATRALAAALPDATYRTLPGQNHMVKARAIAPVLTEFFSTHDKEEDTTMRQIAAGLFISLDGVIEAPEKWTGPYFNDQVGQAVGALMAGNDAMLLGRVTYEGFAAAFGGQSGGMADQMNSTPKYVVSSTLASAELAELHADQR